MVQFTQQINLRSSLNAQTPTANTIIIPVAKRTFSSNPNFQMLLCYYGETNSNAIIASIRLFIQGGKKEDSENEGLHRSVSVIRVNPE